MMTVENDADYLFCEESMDLLILWLSVIYWWWWWSFHASVDEMSIIQYDAVIIACFSDNLFTDMYQMNSVLILFSSSASVYQLQYFRQEIIYMNVKKSDVDYECLLIQMEQMEKDEWFGNDLETQDTMWWS